MNLPYAHAYRRALEHYRRHGARRTVGRVIAELEAARQRRASRATVKLVVPEVQPDDIRAHIDTPHEGSPEGSAHLVVSGWAYSPGRATSVEIYLGQECRARTSAVSARPDVAAVDPKAGAGSSGFSARVPVAGLEPGQHVLQVVFRDDAGSVRVLTPSFVRIEPDSMYHHFFVRSQPTPAELDKMMAWAESSADAAPIQLVVRAGGAPAEALEATIASIAAQAYPAWSGTLLWPDASPAQLAALTAQLADPARWTVTSRSAEALPSEVVGTRLVGFIEAGEVLAAGALVRYAQAAVDTDVRLVYSDHDVVQRTGRHVDPWFVSDWSPDRLLCQDYVGGVFLTRDGAELREYVVPILATPSTAWRYGLLLDLTTGGQGIRHVPQVLWSGPVAGDQRAARAQAEQQAVRAYVSRRDEHALVETVSFDGAAPVRRVVWSLDAEPRVSVIVPTTGRLELVSETLDYLERRTAYGNVEVIFLDNSRGLNPDGIELLRASSATVIEQDEAFNWARLNNVGAAASRGQQLLFLNDDMTVTDPEWLDQLVRHAARPGIGAVGALLSYPDGRIQHAGVMVVGHGGGAAHLLHGLGDEDELYLDLHLVTREVTAVTGACLMISREAFEEVGGFDEALAVIGNDVDLCLRVARTGRRNVWTPQTALVHRESASRADVDHIPDEGKMWRRWSGELLAGDPYYNPNLAQDRIDCGLDWSRVADRVDPVTTLDAASGVNLVGYIRAEMGIGEATRGEAQALHDAAVPFVIIDHRQGNPARMDDRSWLHKVVDEPVFDTNILHVNADVLPVAISQLPDGLLEGRRNIGYWTWELPRFPRRWQASFDLVDEVWVPSSFVRDAIGADASVPVHVVPHAVRAPGGPFLGRADFGLPEEGYQCLAMYDTQSVQQRKNPQGAVEAFWRAFGDDDSVSLVLKVNSAGSRELDALRQLTAGRRNVHIMSDVLSRVQVDSLMACSDAFISLHRSEGFGLPIAEAMALGKPVVATGWSGNMDFMSEQTAACVAYRIVELEGTYGPYEAGQRWAEPDLDDAAAWLQRLQADPAQGRAMGARAATSILESNGFRTVGRILAARLGST